MAEKTTKAAKPAKAPAKTAKAAKAPAKAAKPAKAPAKTAKAAKAPAKAAKPAKAPAKTAKAAKAPAKAKKAAGGDKSVKAMDLFQAYSQDKLPKDKAYIVSSFVNGNTGYTRYEVISYSAVKAIYPDGGGLTFQSSGKKMHMLIEPASYPNKAIEPYLRDKTEQIPLRFKELNLHTAKNQIKIYMAKKPIESLSSFSVAKPVGFNVTFLFYNLEDIYKTLGKFFEESFNKDAAVPQSDAKTAAKQTIEVVEKLMAFKSDFG